MTNILTFRNSENLSKGLIYRLFPTAIVGNNNASTDYPIPETLGGSYFWRSVNHIDGEVTDPIGIHLRQGIRNHPLYDIDAGDRTERLDDFLVTGEYPPAGIPRRCSSSEIKHS